MNLDKFYPIFETSDWLERLLPIGIKLVQLRIKDKSKTSEIFDIYEKIVFAKNYKPKFKQFFNLNYKIIKLSYFNNSN